MLAARWQKTGRHLVTTGDVVNVWDARVMRAAEPQPLWRFDDNIGIVKAVEFVPFLGASVNMIATGSGIGDTAVRIHSLDSGMRFSCVNVRHPVRACMRLCSRAGPAWAVQLEGLARLEECVAQVGPVP